MSTDLREMQECKCGADSWFHMPDSLAWACSKCGEVIIELGKDRFEDGVSIKDWLSDVYGKSK